MKVCVTCLGDVGLPVKGMKSMAKCDVCEAPKTAVIEVSKEKYELASNGEVVGTSKSSTVEVPKDTLIIDNNISVTDMIQPVQAFEANDGSLFKTREEVIERNTELLSTFVSEYVDDDSITIESLIKVLENKKITKDVLLRCLKGLQ